MRTPIAILMLGAVVTLGWIVACDNVKQPKPLCTIGQGAYTVKYTPKPGQTLTGACAQNKGELISIRDYGDKRTTYFIGIRTETLGKPTPGYPDNPNNVLYSFGAYPFDPGPDDFCVAPTLSVATQQLAASALPDGGTLPAINRSYRWSNVRILMTPQGAGTQFTADLTYTDGDCTANYDVVGVWPGVSCASGMVAGNRVGPPKPDLCATRPDPARGIDVGCTDPAGRVNCLSSDQKVKCDPDILLCVLDGTPPVFVPR